MDGIRGRRPSPATVVALIALFVALGGTAFAALSVDSRDIDNNTIVSKDLKNRKAVKGADVKNRSLTGADLRDGSLTTANLADNAVNGLKIADDSISGDDLAEATLGQVPSADTANTATSANAVGGLTATRISYSAAESTGAQTIFDGAGLQLVASCGAASILDLDATTTKNDSNIFLTSVQATGTNTTDGFNQENQNFDTGVVIEVEDDLGGGDHENVTIQYFASDGAVAAVEVALDDEDAAPGCQVSGFGLAG